MTDTNKKMDKIYITMMQKKTNEERLIMGCSMFDTAKAIVLSSINNNLKILNENNIKVELFLRFYAVDYTDIEKQKIIKCLRT